MVVVAVVEEVVVIVAVEAEVDVVVVVGAAHMTTELPSTHGRRKNSSAVGSPDTNVVLFTLVPCDHAPRRHAKRVLHRATEDASGPDFNAR